MMRVTESLFDAQPESSRRRDDSKNGSKIRALKYQPRTSSHSTEEPTSFAMWNNGNNGGGLYGNSYPGNTPNMYNYGQASYAAPAYGAPATCGTQSTGPCQVTDLTRNITLSAPVTTQHTQTLAWNTVRSQPFQVTIPHTVEAVDHGYKCVNQQGNPCACPGGR